MTNSPEHVAAEALLPCPFCGNAPKLRRLVEEYDADGEHPAGEYDAWYRIDCDECGIEVGEEYRGEAIAAWNRRQSPAGQADAVGGDSWIADWMGEHDVVLKSAALRDLRSRLTASPSPAGAVAPAAGALTTLDIAMAIGAEVRRRNRVGEPGEKGAISQACEYAAAALVIAALNSCGFSIVRPPAPHPDTDSGGGQAETVEINGKSYRKFIPYPQDVDDGTLRCIACGQIDEEPYHDAGLCPACPSPAPQAPDAQGGVDEAQGIEDQWRDLALQFDGHRIQALSLLRAIASGQDVSGDITAFLSAPPLSGEHILAERIAALGSALQPAGVDGWRPSQGAQDVLAERRRQIEVEGWTSARDDKYKRGELATAASSYAYEASRTDHQREGDIGNAPPMWPWAEMWWKPTTRRRDLIKAGALIIAELDRLDRLTSPSASHAAPQGGE